MSTTRNLDCLTVGIAQISPVWLNRERTLDKISEHVSLAAREDCQLVIFGEALLPGYPFWSASGLMRKSDFPPGTPHLETILKNCPDMLANGGSCIAGPDGEWVVEPVVGKEKLIVATLDYHHILRERQNFDPAGHYARPDVTQLTVNRQRQNTVKIID